MPFGIGIWELLILLLVLLLVFGPKRLPEMGRQLGKGMREFKDSISGRDDGRSELPIGTQDTGGPVPARGSSAGNPDRSQRTELCDTLRLALSHDGQAPGHGQQGRLRRRLPR